MMGAIAGKMWLKYALIGAAIYLGFCVLLFAMQRRLIYQPTTWVAPLPDGFEPWFSAEQEHWGYKRVNGAEECLFFFHGNGGNASGWSHAVAEFPGDVFVLEYPGYGPRAGHASERAIKKAAVEGFEAEQKAYRKVVVCGQSLGSAVTEAIFSAHPERIHRLVLVTPFLSLAEVAGEHFRFFPARWMVRDTMHLFEVWQKFPGRTSIVVAGQDEVIPRSHGVRWLAATNDNVRVLELPEASHNSVELDAEFWEEVLGE